MYINDIFNCIPFVQKLKNVFDWGDTVLHNMSVLSLWPVGIVTLERDSVDTSQVLDSLLLFCPVGVCKDVFEPTNFVTNSASVDTYSIIFFSNSLQTFRSNF